ncbi:MAG: DUF3047 domain-containing protein [Betaproteobacteria bacterium]|nr:MAG: DUF3047 domain-containing protein [Betaproteobacteria bacterium]
MGRMWRAALIAALMLVAGCATAPSGQTPPGAVTLPHVGRFSGHPPGDALPAGWQPWLLSSFKRPTQYRLVSREGKTVVRAQARGSASGLVHPLALDPVARPLLQWHWKVDGLIDKADNTQKHLEDAPARLVVSFDGDMAKLPAQDRMFFDSVRILTGQQLPYATLMYIWENRAPRESVIINEHTARIRMIVVESGRDRLGVWQEVTRNIVEDYRRAFGEEPGPVTAVGIMTDTDNTGDHAHAYYGDIAFREAAPSAATAAAAR